MNQTASSSSFSRKIQWMAIFVAGLVVLVVAAWFIAAHFYRQAIDTGRETLAREGVTLDCQNEALGGFPARFEWQCDALTLNFANGATLSGGAFTTVAPAWNPLFTILEWTGPFETVNGDGVDAQITSELMRASVRLDTSLQLQRLSATLDPFSVIMQRAPQAIASATQGEVHVRPPEGAAAGSADLEVAVLMLGVQSLLLGSTQQVDVSLTGVVEHLGAVRARAVQQGVAQWTQLGGRIAPLATRLRIDDHAVNLDGNLRLHPDGLVDFDGAIATNDVPALVSFFGVNDPSAAMALNAGAAFFGEQVTIGEEAATQLPLSIERSAINLGPVSLGRLPAITF